MEKDEKHREHKAKKHGDSHYLLQMNSTNQDVIVPVTPPANIKVAIFLSTVLMFMVVMAILLTLNKKKYDINKKNDDIRDDMVYELVR